MKPSKDWPSTRPFLLDHARHHDLAARDPDLLADRDAGWSNSLSATSYPMAATGRRSRMSGSVSGTPAENAVVLDDLIGRRDAEDEHVADGAVAVARRR